MDRRKEYVKAQPVIRHRAQSRHAAFGRQGEIRMIGGWFVPNTETPLPKPASKPDMQFQAFWGRHMRLFSLRTATGKIVMMAGLFCMTGLAGAQLAPYAMFSAGHYSGQGVGNGTAATQSGGMTALGGTFGLYDNFLRLGP